MMDTEILHSDKLADEDLRRDRGNLQVIKILANLSHEQRQVVELKLFQNMTFDEIEQTTGLSANTAKTRFYAAIQNLRNLVEVPHAV